MKLYVDDERPAPEGWTLALSSAEAIELLTDNDVTELSLDYSLKDWDNGAEVLYWLKDHRDRCPASIVAHSSSSSGRELLERVISTELGMAVPDEE